MKKRILIFVLSLTLLIIALAGCAPKATFSVGNDSVDLEKIVTSEAYNEYIPSEGNKLVLVYCSSSSETDVDAMTENFLTGSSIAYITAASGDYQCSGVAYEETTSGVNIILIFEVPSATSGEITLYANAVGSITQNIN